MMRLLARIFGKKTVGIDCSPYCYGVCEAYELFGKTYIWKIKVEIKK